MRIAIARGDRPLRAWEASCIEALAREDVSIDADIVLPERLKADDGRAAAERFVEPVPSLLWVPKTGSVPPDLDALLVLGESAPAVDVPPRLGTWSLRVGGARLQSGTATDAARAALTANDHLLCAQLVRDGSSALRTGWFETTPHSYEETIDTACFGMAAWPAIALRELAAGLSPRSEPLERERASTRSQGAWSRVLFATALFWRGVALRLGYLFRHEHWNVGIAHRPIASFAAGGCPRDIEWLPRPRIGRFAADPFGISRNGTLTLLCEEFDYRDRRGFLSSATMHGGSLTAAWRPVLREALHLSYPYLIEKDATVYCVPESSEVDEVTLHEAVDFPYAWKRRATLLPNFGGADATPFEHGGRWWMLCTGKDGPNRDLYAWYADDLFGPWIAHARNPVKIDPRSARPAGTPFRIEGELFRPAQDCAGDYGRRIAVMHVTKLSPTEFSEEVVAHVEPDARGPYPSGMHTLSAAGDVTLVDGKYYRFVPLEFARVLAQYAGALRARLGMPSKGRARA